MPDIPAPIPPSAPNGKAGPTPVVAWQIVLLSDGNVSVSGPIDNLPLTAKVMGQALGAAADFQARKAGAKLVQAAPASALRILEGN